jgi:FixJ family two-component response regulator
LQASPPGSRPSLHQRTLYRTAAGAYVGFMSGGISPCARPASSALNVAIVDDDEGVRRSLSRMLCAAGFNASSYASAEQFLEYATQPLVDCLVLDINLGGMSGFDLQRHLAASGNAPPIIFMTAHQQSGTAEQARRARCAAYLAKPFPGQLLVTAIERAVAPVVLVNPRNAKHPA